LKHKHLGARRIFANLRQGFATKRRESSEEDNIRSSQCNWEDAIGSCVEVGGDDEKLAPTYF
jgi:hypothetical protein